MRGGGGGGVGVGKSYDNVSNSERDGYGAPDGKSQKYKRISHHSC